MGAIQLTSVPPYSFDFPYKTIPNFLLPKVRGGRHFDKSNIVLPSDRVGAAWGHHAMEIGFARENHQGMSKCVVAGC